MIYTIIGRVVVALAAGTGFAAFALAIEGFCASVWNDDETMERAEKWVVHHK